MIIKIAKTDAEILLCLPVLKHLRPHLLEKTFIADVRRMEHEGFCLCSLSVPDVIAVAGYRLLETFAMGKTLYVDDLVTNSSQRSKGYGKELFNWLLNESKRLGCQYLILDSGLKRIDAHRFYRKHGMQEVGLHFSIPANAEHQWTT